MTENESAIETLEFYKEERTFNSEDEASLDYAIKAIKEIEQYRAIGTVEEIKEILQIISEGQEDVDEDGISIGLLNTLLEYVEYAKIGTVEECREAINNLKAKDGYIKQILWERDIAIQQLEEIGVSLGEKMDPVKEARER